MTDSYLIRVQASPVPIEGELNLGDSLHAIIEGEVVKIELKDDYDGSISTIYHIKGQFAECINRDKQSIIKDGKTNKKDNRPSKESY